MEGYGNYGRAREREDKQPHIPLTALHSLQPDLPVMTANPLFSVIIPSFNRSNLLMEAASSVLDQTFSDYELIIVDDGSTDDTADRVRDLSSRGVRYIRQENRGPSTARNEGARFARGRYLAFLDSDDLWLPEKLEKQALFFTDHPNCLICQTEELWMKKGRRVFPKKKHRKQGGYIFPRAVELCLVSPSAVAIRRDFFLSIGGFDENLPAAEDYDLWIRISCRLPIELIDEPLVVKRSGDWDQLSFTTEAIDRYRIRALEKILESGVLDPEQGEIAFRELRKKADIYIAGCEKRGNREEARRIRDILSRIE